MGSLPARPPCCVSVDGTSGDSGGQHLVVQVAGVSPPTLSKQTAPLAGHHQVLFSKPDDDDVSDCESVISSMSFSSSTSRGGAGRGDSVSNFVRELVRGRPVTLVKEVPYDPFVQRTLATLCLQRDLRTLSIHGADVLISLLVTDIMDIFRVDVDGTDVFPRQIIDGLTPGEIGRLARVHHTSKSGAAMAFCFLEARAQSRNLLLQTLKVLIRRAQRQGQRPEQRLTAASWRRT
mmetsp:Transcript_42899/g.121274  ORF Transcript_42899/g.121274 Transcript_42899/m.121274 type:complete len:234 (+) Transcript_42899:58-759(+)